jgi:hypothetical protein
VADTSRAPPTTSGNRARYGNVSTIDDSTQEGGQGQAPGKEKDMVRLLID